MVASSLDIGGKDGLPLFPGRSPVWTDEQVSQSPAGTFFASPFTNNSFGYTESLAKSPLGAAWGHGWAKAARAIGATYFNAHAYAAVATDIAPQPRAESLGEWRDPTTFSWTDNSSHTFVMNYSMRSALLDRDPIAETASLSFRSFLDLNTDGVFDQLFWSIDLRTSVGEAQFTDLRLGPGVFIDDGRTASQVMSSLVSYWLNPRSFSLTSPFDIPFAYTVFSGQPGSISISYDGDSFSAAEVPEPSSLVLGTGTLVAAILAFTARYRRRARPPVTVTIEPDGV